MRILERARFEEIMESDNTNWDGDNAVQGLIIIAKYLPVKNNELLCGAEHDIIYSVDTKKILDAGLTEEDAIELRNLNWMIETDVDSLACFV